MEVSHAVYCSYQSDLNISVLKFSSRGLERLQLRPAAPAVWAGLGSPVA